MATIKVANFAFIQTGRFTLPGIRTTGTGDHPHIRANEVIHFDLPNDTRERGMLSFYFDTDKGADDGIDLAFEVSLGNAKYKWSFHGDAVACFQLPVSGLKAGDNYVVFNMTKGGTVTLPDPDEYLNGKGVVHFGQVCLTFHRDVVL